MTTAAAGLCRRIAAFPPAEAADPPAEVPVPGLLPAAPGQQPFTHRPTLVAPNVGLRWTRHPLMGHLRRLPSLGGAPFEESPAERLARKEKRERQNINVTLYVASLLLVAAGALFVGTSLPAVMFCRRCLITALFYGAGSALPQRLGLRPAAVAFAGTGLALVPVAGLAMYNFAVQDGPLAWLMTSVVGTLATSLPLFARSRVLVYLSLTFVVSTAWSGVAVLGASLIGTSGP